MELTVQNLYGLLLRSRLLSADDARALFARWNEEARAPDNVAEFAKWMVANRHVTEYQAALLARGHADSFFLDRYKLLDRLGKGRMAGVYRARHETGSVVAVKVLPPSKARDATLLARFQREARLALKLRHANVVRTFEVGEAEAGAPEKVHYLVMEYIEGETLEDVLQRRKQLPPAEAVRIAHQALLGLQHLHENGIVHRDLKPANLMLAYPPGPAPRDSTLSATVKILDMGLARALDEAAGEQVGGPVPDSALTGEGIVLGTPDYMAPEQARDARSADVRADVYSLGCVLYHLLAGQPPFPDTNIISQMIRHASEEPRPLREVNPAVPDGLQQILNWMMAKAPARRYATPGRAAQALQVYLAAGGEPALAPESDPKMKKYLTWLEVGAREQEKTPPARPAPEPPAPAGKKKTKKRKPTGPPPVRKTAPPPAESPQVGVELQAVALAPGPEGSGRVGLALTRRDLLMFGLGAVTVGAGVGLGLAAAWLAGAFERKDAPQDGDQ